MFLKSFLHKNFAPLPDNFPLSTGTAGKMLGNQLGQFLLNCRTPVRKPRTDHHLPRCKATRPEFSALLFGKEIGFSSTGLCTAGASWITRAPILPSTLQKSGQCLVQSFECKSVCCSCVSVLGAAPATWCPSARWAQAEHRMPQDPLTAGPLWLWSPSSFPAQSLGLQVLWTKCTSNAPSRLAGPAA